MRHVIIGYGYCGFYLARELLQGQQEVISVSRHVNDAWRLPGVTHLQHDIDQPLPDLCNGAVLYYLIPPPEQGVHDERLRRFLTQNTLRPARVVYFGSSSVYGDQQGAWVNEQSPCFITRDRQRRRLDAEAQWLSLGVETVLLRIAGIYGPGRLPLEAAARQSPLIRREEAPFTNRIYVRDLAKIAASLVNGCYNVADGQVDVMGSLQQQVAEACAFAAAPWQSFEQIWQQASPMKREFMTDSKRLGIDALQQALPGFVFTPVVQAIRDSLPDSV